MRCHLAHVHREVRGRHLLFDRALQSSRAIRGMEEEAILLVVVQRSKKRNALDMIPMKVGKKDVRANGLACILGDQAFSQIAKAGAAVEDVHLTVDADLHARRIAAIAQIFSLGSRSRSAYAPEFHSHPNLSAPTFS